MPNFGETMPESVVKNTNEKEPVPEGFKKVGRELGLSDNASVEEILEAHKIESQKINNEDPARDASEEPVSEGFRIIGKELGLQDDASIEEILEAHKTESQRINDEDPARDASLEN